MDLLEAQRVQVDVLVLRRDGDHPLGADDITCLVRRPREGNWRRKDLSPSSWIALGHSVYSLRLDPEDVPEPGLMSVLIEGKGIHATLASFSVVSRLQSASTAVMLTTLVGRVTSLDGKPKAKAAVIAKMAVAATVGGAAISQEPISVETDEQGEFSLPLVTGTQVVVTIQAVGWSKQFVVPPPHAAGLPVRIFSV